MIRFNFGALLTRTHAIFVGIKLRAGFSVLEILVTCGVTILLTSMLILYSRTGQLQILLISERAKILGLITQAKSLSVQTLAEANPPCGYGVFIDAPQNRYLLFKNTSPIGQGSVCTDIKDGSVGAYYNPTPAGSPQDVVISSSTLSSGIKFPSATLAYTILFIPPDPTVLFTDSIGDIASNLTITIETDSPTPEQTSVSINRFGQITY